jgi:hypothetical protein
MSWRDVRGERRRGPWAGELPGAGEDRRGAGAGPIFGPGWAAAGSEPGKLDAHGLPGPSGHGPEPGPRLRSRIGGAVLGLVLGAASSTVTTALAVGVAGRHADRFFQPIEFTIRVALLLAAPCMGAVLAALFAAVVVPRKVVPAPWAMGLGVVAGPILALRLDRVQDLGVETVVTFAVLLVCWAVVGGLLAAAATARAGTRSRGTGRDLYGPH